MTGGKSCKHCSAKSLPGRRICWTHFREREKQKREEKAKKKLERKIKTKKYQESVLKHWKKKTWKAMSEWVRRKDADWRGYMACFTCDAVKHWKEMQAGHRHHRRLDYDPRNIHKQCRHCNGQITTGGLGGNLGEYERRLCKIYGHEWCEKLLLDANTHPGYSLLEIMKIYYDL